ncbi:uncharacterized protein [Parasteatoda tepidariorum]|uniref:uncharacterized protein n=1 Tax=Parasteatoda tepidariorum TaxID=114398 RepID=UPI00077FB452|nr:uncharacterized protein LOC107442837 [Parasteatoda tepidariorum]
MMFFGTIVLCSLASLAASDFRCFEDSRKACASQWFEENDSDEFCAITPNMTRCDLEAALVCHTGFAEIAEKALATEIDVCTEGTAANEAVKKDKNCSFDTWLDLKYCDVEEGTICQTFDIAQECADRIFSKCSRDTEKAFQGAFKASAELQKKVCELQEKIDLGLTTERGD